MFGYCRCSRSYGSGLWYPLLSWPRVYSLWTYLYHSIVSCKWLPYVGKNFKVVISKISKLDGILQCVLVLSVIPRLNESECCDKHTMTKPLRSHQEFMNDEFHCYENGGKIPKHHVRRKNTTLIQSPVAQPSHIFLKMFCKILKCYD